MKAKESLTELVHSEHVCVQTMSLPLPLSPSLSPLLPLPLPPPLPLHVPLPLLRLLLAHSALQRHCQLHIY